MGRHYFWNQTVIGRGSGSTKFYHMPSGIELVITGIALTGSAESGYARPCRVQIPALCNSHAKARARALLGTETENCLRDPWPFSGAWRALR